MQSIPHPNDTSDEIWLWLASWFQRYSYLKVWTHARMDAQMPARVPYYKLTLSLWLWWAKKTFWPHHRGRGCVCKDSIFAFMMICAQFPLIWYATWPFSEKKTSSPMGNNRSPGSQHVWRHHNLGCSKAGNSELETVIRNKFKCSRFYASSGYLQVSKRSE